MPRFWKRFHPTDAAQQVIGSILLAGPFVVTEEVWNLSRNMDPLQVGVAVLFVLVVGYGALYKADRDREPEKEAKLLGVPTRWISLMVVTYSSVALLIFLFSAPETFNASLWTTVKAVSVGAIFAVIGAATADSLF